MSDMTDERAAEVLDWFSKFGPLGTAEIGHAIDHAVSRLRSQPPAEAQGGGEVVAYGVYAKSEEYPKPVLLPEYVGSMDVIRGRVLSKARREGFTGDFVERMAELGWWIEPLALASAPPSATVGVEAKDAEIEALRAEVEHMTAGMNAALAKVIEFRNARHEAESRAERLAEALDNIARVGKASRNQTTRTRWIVARAVSALNGDNDWRQITKPKGYHDALERTALRDHDQEGKDG